MYHKLRHSLLYGIEKLYLQVQSAQYKYPPIFIIGSIRSGTTIVYQYLNAYYHFAFFPNIARLENSGHPLLSTWLSKSYKKFTPSFESSYGDIKGEYAPSDGWKIFHRWFSYHMNPSATKDLTELRKLIVAFEKLYGAPFINKNNSNTLRLIELSRAFPDALFIHVHRNIYDTVNSVLKGRKKHQVLADKFWAAAPDMSLLSISFDSELDLVVYQYLFANIFFHEMKQKLPINPFELDYEEFIKAPEIIAEGVSEFYPKKLKVRTAKFIKAIKNTSGRTRLVENDEIDSSVSQMKPIVQADIRKIISVYSDFLQGEQASFIP